MKKFFNVCKSVAVFATGAFVAAGLEYGFCAEIVCGLVLAVAVYGSAMWAGHRIPAEIEE